MDEESNITVVGANAEKENRPILEEVEGGCFQDDSSDEDDFMVTIGDIRATPSGFSHHLQQNHAEGQPAMVDFDAKPLCNGSVIYDSDLAAMVDKPWKKPGANITDYFNYGFNEDTWNQYCERQKKFRSEFGEQSAVNRAILDEIHLSSTSASSPVLSSFANGRQLLSIVGGDWPKPRAARMIIPLRPVNPAMEPLAVSEAAYVSQSVIPALGSVSDETNVLMPQDFSVPPPVDFSKLSPIDFTKPPPTFIAPSSFENYSFSSTKESEVSAGVKEKKRKRPSSFENYSFTSTKESEVSAGVKEKKRKKDSRNSESRHSEKKHKKSRKSESRGNLRGS